MTTTRTRGARPAGQGSVVQLRPHQAARRLRPIASELRAHFAGARKLEPQHARLFDILSDVLARGERTMPPPHREPWGRLLEALAQHGNDRRAVRNCAVMANLVAVALFDDDRDLTTLAGLVDDLGHERVARIQNRCGRMLESNPGLPVTTAAIRRLLAEALPARIGEQAATACATAAHHLVLEGVDEDWSVPTLDSVEEFLDIVDGGTVVEWRHHLSVVAAGPWSPYSYRLVELAREAGRAHAADVLGVLIELCREQYKDRERELIAHEIKRLVAMSGVTQREFAQRVGTSPSRLSTYLSGAVTPSAALLLRMKRTSLALQQRTDGPDAAPTRPTLLSVTGGAARRTHAVG